MDSKYDTPSPADCPTIEQLQAFYHGNLTATEIESISKHVEQCERCASLLVDWSGVDADAESSPRPLDTVPDTVSYEYPPSEPERIGRYRILRMIGRGGFGRVLLARDEELHRLVAIKVPHPERISAAGDLENYHREARLHAAVDHPHIIPIYDVGASDTTPFFAVSKFVPGMNLSDRLKRQRPDLRTAAAWMAALADALEHIHEQNLVHRDIKPRNIMIDARGQPFLMDFGLAKVLVDGQRGGHTLIVGTPAYMSPEQARGERAVLDHRSDIYSLGVVFYELLTGRRPFQGGTTPILDQLQSLEPIPPRQCNARIPRDLQAVCLKALAKDPAGRYQRSAHLAEDLRHWLAREPLRHARRVGRLERAGLWMRRRPLAAAMTAVVVIALALAGWVFFSPPPPGPTVKVAVNTVPPGAELHFFPIDPKSGLLQPRLGKRGKAGAPLPLTPGYYLVVAVLADGRFHEVLRYVPQRLDERHAAYWHHDYTAKGDVAYLPRIEIPDADAAAGMCLVPPAEAFSMGSAENRAYPVHRRRVPSFYLDPKEVTVDDFLRVRPHFRFPVDKPVPAGIMPMTGINWDDAAVYAESIGKRLPDETEYEYAATNLGRRPRRAAIQGWPFAPSGQPETDRVTLEGQPPIFGLCSNVAEWTNSWNCLYPGQAMAGPPWADPKIRVVRGGPWSVILGFPDDRAGQWQPYERVAQPIPSFHPGLGFRCARSAKARLRPEDFIERLP